MSGPTVLAIETSCDETGVAVVTGGRRIAANQVATQIALHAATGGIVPEVAARQQLRWIVPTIRAAMAEAEVGWGDLDAVAVTCGPGLIGSLLVGVNVAKALAVAHDLPLVGGEPHRGPHLRQLADRCPRRRAAAGGAALPAPLPGGERRSHPAGADGRPRPIPAPRPDGRRCRRRGVRQGRAGCSACRIPGGPAISAAAEGARAATRFPRARPAGRYDFSFSGLKTAVLREVAGYRERGQPIPVDGLAAAFEEAVVDALVTRTVAAAEEHDVAAVALGGGVAANRSLRAVLRERLAATGLPLLVPPPAWCTDNGAMIGAAAGFRFAAGDRATPALEATPNLALALARRVTGPLAPERLLPPHARSAAPPAGRRAAATAEGAEPELPDRFGRARRDRGRRRAATRATGWWRSAPGSAC